MCTQKTQGEDAFEGYYAGLFGSRWRALRNALVKEPQPVPFSVCGGKPYYLDRASIYAAQALPPSDDGSYLDMCAAPGGKTLVLAARMGEKARIQANELSRARRSRLLTVLAKHLPQDIRSRIDVTGFDAATIPRRTKKRYDRILLDAPCSSERHVITDAKHLAAWTPSRVKILAQRQWALLSAAFLLLKQGGFLVYATCALTDTENDCVIEKLLKKYGKTAIIRGSAVPSMAPSTLRTLPAMNDAPSVVIQGAMLPEPMKGASSGSDTDENIDTAPAVLCEKTVYGYRFLPDMCAGLGPLYFSLIEKAP